MLKKKLFFTLILILLFGISTAYAETLFYESFEAPAYGDWPYYGGRSQRGHKIEVLTDDQNQNYGAIVLNKASTETGGPYVNITPNSYNNSNVMTFESVVSIKNSNGRFGAFIWLYDEGRNYMNPIQIVGNTLYTNDGNKKLIEMEEGAQYRVAVTIDFTKHIYKVYVDGDLLASNISTNAFTGKTIKEIRCSIERLQSDYSEAEFGFDDLTIHDGKQPLSAKEIEKLQNSATEDQSSMAAVREEVKDLLFFYKNTKTYFKDAKLIDMPFETYYKNNMLYIPLRSVVEELGGSVDYNKTTGEIFAKYNSGLITSKNKKNVEVVNGTAYISAEALANLLGQDCQMDEVGFAAIGNKKDFYDWDKEEKLIFYTIRAVNYRIPDGYDMVADAFNHSGGQHPRLVATKEQFDIVRQEVAKGYDPLKTWYEQLITKAERYLDIEPAAFKLDDIHRSQALAKQQRDLIKTLGIAYWITKDERYAQRGIEEIMVMCTDKEKWPHWNYYDPLSCSETSYSVSYGYDFFYHLLTEQQRADIRKALYDNFLFHYRNGIMKLTYYKTPDGTVPDDIYARSGPSWREYGMRDNFTMTINVAVMNACLAIFDEPDSRAIAEEFLAYGMEDIIGVYLGFVPSGAWYEGNGYWFMMSWGLRSLGNALENACGDDYNIMNYPAMDKTADFIMNIHGPAGTFNFSDAEQKYENITPGIFYLSRYYNQKGVFEAASSFAQRHILTFYPNQVVDYALAKNHFDNYQGEVTEMGLDRYWKRIETVVFRDSWDESSANFIGLHAGRNTDTHAHLDTGMVILDAFGKRFFYDYGKEDYNVSTKMTVFRKHVTGHNLLVFNPTTCEYGQIIEGDSAGAKITELESNKVDAFAVTDLSDVWTDYVKDYKRGIRFTEEKNVFVIQDEYKLRDNVNEMYWLIHTKADIEIGEDKKTATLTVDNVQLDLKVISENDGEFVELEAKPFEGSETAAIANQTVNVGYRILAFKFNKIEDGTFSVACIPRRIGIPTSLQFPELQAIDDWTLVDDSYYESVGEVELNQIYVDGKPIEGFNKDTKAYEYDLPFGAKQYPVITADNPEAVVYQADETRATGYVVIKNGKSDIVYTIHFKRQIVVDDVPGLELIPHKEIIVSAEPQEQNPGRHLWDNNFDTRWSATGPCNAVYDLGEVMSVDALGLAWYLGNERQIPMDISYSEDGEVWNPVFEGASTGKTLGYEYYDLGGIKARYIKVAGYANWVSITEMKVFKMAE